MINEPFSPQEQALIQQIQAIPHLEIGPLARDAIRQRMLTDYRAINQQAAASAARLRLVRLVVVVAVIVAAALVIGVILFNRSADKTESGLTSTAMPQATPTLMRSETPMITPIMTQATTSSPSVTSTGRATMTPQPALSATAETAPPLIPPAVFVSTRPASATETSTLLPVVSPAATEGSTPMPVVSPSVTQTSTSIPVASPTATADALIVIEGPVINIVNNIITVYDFEVEVEANHPMLNLIQIGDIVRIEGAYNSTGVVVAQVISNVSDVPLMDGATVSLQGPVESITGNLIVINGIAVQLADDDPLLQRVQVGQFVRVQGNFQASGGTFVLVVVNIVVNVNTTTTTSGDTNGGNGDCYWKESGMSGMGKWKCKDKGEKDD